MAIGTSVMGVGGLADIAAYKSQEVIIMYSGQEQYHTAIHSGYVIFGKDWVAELQNLQYLEVVLVASSADSGEVKIPLTLASLGLYTAISIR